MSRLGRRVSRIEETAEAGRFFVTTICEEDIPRDQQAAFLAAECERRGIGENDHHFITIYEARP